MSIPVELQNLADTISRYRFAYLLTSSGDGAPHAVAVNPDLQDGELVVGGLGRRTRANVGIRPAVALVWPPREETDYSLIVDGLAVVDGEGTRIRVTRAVLHRPAPAGGAEADDAGNAAGAAAGGCGADCVEIVPVR